MFRALITLFSTQLTGRIRNSLLISSHMEKKAFKSEKWSCQTDGEGNELWRAKKYSILGKNSVCSSRAAAARTLRGISKARGGHLQTEREQV